MKFNKFILFLILIGSLAASSYAQSNIQYAFASKMLYFNSGGLISQSNENLSPVADSSCSTFTFSFKNLYNYKGTFYQAIHTSKFDFGFSKSALIKSSDGINWSPLVRAGDAPIGKTEIYSNIYVWEKNNTLKIGIAYVDFSTANPQQKFSVSTNGGSSFNASVQVSGHNDNNHILNGGVTGRGDTIALCWVSRVGGNSDKTWFSRSTDGGVTWSPMMIAFQGTQFSYISDMEADNSGNLFIVVSHAVGTGSNLVVRRSTDLGTTWTSITPITGDPQPHMNQFQQVRFFNGSLYAVWVHNFNISCYYDKILFSKSSTSGASWSTPVIISDEDTLNARTGNNSMIYLHPSITFTPSGTIYVSWADSRMRHSPTIDSCRFNVYLSRSTSGGTIWSPSLLVNGPSNISQIHNFYTTLSVESSGGIDSVLVVWTKIRGIGNIGIINISGEIPEKYQISQNYPNPFNPFTNIEFRVPEHSFVKLLIYDLQGRVAETLVNQELKAGTYRADWNASGYSSGVYFYKIETKNFTETKKMILIK